MFAATNISDTWQPLLHSCDGLGCNGNGLFGDGLGTVTTEQGFEYGTIGGIQFDSDELPDAPDALMPPGARFFAWNQYGLAVAIVARFEGAAEAVPTEVSFADGLTIDLTSVPVVDLADQRLEGFYIPAIGLTHLPEGSPGSQGEADVGSWIDVSNELEFRVVGTETDPNDEGSAIVDVQIANSDQGYEHGLEVACVVLDRLGYLHSVPSEAISPGPGVTLDLPMSVSNLNDSLAQNVRASGLDQLDGGILACSGDSNFVLSIG